MALHLSADGIDILGTYQSRKEDADAVIREIEGHGGRAAMVQLDVTSFPSLTTFSVGLVAELQAAFGRHDFDYLVITPGVVSTQTSPIRPSNNLTR